VQGLTGEMTVKILITFVFISVIVPQRLQRCRNLIWLSAV
jgi:hypothetical protein